MEQIRLETRKTLELVQFVDIAEIPPLYYDKPYYVVPTDALAQDAYRVVRDALRQSKRVGLGQLTMRGKEYLCAVKPCGDGLLLETLVYQDEINNAPIRCSPSIAEDAVDADLLEVAHALIDRKTAPFDPAAFHDHYAEALQEMVAAKVANRKTPARAEGGQRKRRARRRATDNVIDLMEALKQSLKAAGPPKPAAQTAPKAARTRQEGRVWLT